MNSDDVVQEIRGKAVSPVASGQDTRTLGVASRVVQRREAILGILRAAYERDRGREVGHSGLG